MANSYLSFPYDEEIFNYFEGMIDGVLINEDTISFDKSNQPVNIPSTIVKVDSHNFEVIREGAIKKNDIIRKVFWIICFRWGDIR